LKLALEMAEIAYLEADTAKPQDKDTTNRFRLAYLRAKVGLKNFSSKRGKSEFAPVPMESL